MLEAFDLGDSDSYWGCFSLLLQVHSEMMGRPATDDEKRATDAFFTSHFDSPNK
jgi:hypothetical protein